MRVNMAQPRAQNYIRFAELVTQGYSKVDAYCAITGKPSDKTAREMASRWWKNPACVRHVAVLKGEVSDEPEIVTVPVEVTQAQMSRAQYVAYLEGGLYASPLDLMARITNDPLLIEASERLTRQEHGQIGTFKFRRRIGKNGSQTIEFEVGTSSKPAFANALQKVQGFAPEKVVDDSMGEGVANALRLADTTR